MAIALAALWMGMGVLPSANAQRPFVVQGELTGLPDGTGFLMMSLQGNYGLMVDGTSSRKGRFRLQGMASKGCMFKLQLTNEVSTMHFLDLWVQDGDTVTIRGNSKYSFDWVVTSTNPMPQEQTAYNDAAKKSISGDSQAGYIDLETHRAAAYGFRQSGSTVEGQHCDCKQKS